MALSVNIRKKLGSFQLEVQFNAEQGIPLALLGASGCGKSVTLRCIAGILKPDEGRITLDGIVLYDSAAGIDLPPQQRRVGYLFQQYALFPNMTVRQNIAAAVRDRKARAGVAAEKLRQFQLESVADLRPDQLSGGQQQRCALARILASAPRVILLDEPFSALDSYLQDQLEVELAQTLEQFSGPVVWVSHDRGEVFRNCPQVCVIDRGISQPVTSLEELFRNPGTEAAARLSGCENFVDAMGHGNTVTLRDWGVTLNCTVPMPDTVCRVGIRARNLHPAEEQTMNAISCRVVRVVEDIDALTVLLRPDGAAPDLPPVRMAATKDTWKKTAGEQIIVKVDPDGILPLETR